MSSGWCLARDFRRLRSTSLTRPGVAAPPSSEAVAAMAARGSAWREADRPAPRGPIAQGASIGPVNIRHT